MPRDDDVMRAIFYSEPLKNIAGVNLDQFIRCGNRLLKESEGFKGSAAHKKFLKNVDRPKPFKDFDLI